MRLSQESVGADRWAHVSSGKKAVAEGNIPDYSGRDAQSVCFGFCALESGARWQVPQTGSEGCTEGFEGANAPRVLRGWKWVKEVTVTSFRVGPWRVGCLLRDVQAASLRRTIRLPAVSAQR